LTSGYARAFAFAAILGAVAFAASFIVPSLGRKGADEAPVEESSVAVVGGVDGALPTLEAHPQGTDVRINPA
jgi:hypothetical protein